MVLLMSFHIWLEVNIVLLTTAEESASAIVLCNQAGTTLRRSVIPWDVGRWCQLDFGEVVEGIARNSRDL